MTWTSELHNPLDTLRLLSATVYLGVGAIGKFSAIADEFIDEGIDQVLVVNDCVAYKKSGAWDAVEPVLKEKGIRYTLFSNIQANPEAAQADEGARIARDTGAKAVIGIGGGSPLDAAKCIAVLAKYPDYSAKELMLSEFIPTDALPIIAINLTHGTSTEAGRGAVLTIPELRIKPSIRHMCMVPRYAIDDARLMSTMPPNQTLFTTVDAFSHAYEAATGKMTTPLAVAECDDCVYHIAANLPKVLRDPQDHASRHFLAYAALMAGQAFTNGCLHLGHLIEHPMSVLNTNLAHGLGIGVLLAATTKWTYRQKPKISAHVLRHILPDLKGVPEEAGRVQQGMTSWLESLGFTWRMGDIGFEAKDVESILELVAKALPRLNTMAPAKVDMDAVRSVLLESF